MIRSLLVLAIGIVALIGHGDGPAGAALRNLGRDTEREASDIE